MVKPQPDFQANAVHIAKLDGAAVSSEFKVIFSADLRARFIVRN